MRRVLMFGAIILFCAPVFAQGVDLEPIYVVGDHLSDGPALTDASYARSSLPTEYLVEQSSGVDVQRNLSYGMLQDVSIRGGVFEDADVSLNGVVLNNPQTGHFNLSLPVVSLDLANASVDLNSQQLQYRLSPLRKTGSVLRTSAGRRGYADGAFSTTLQSGGGDWHRFSLEGMRSDGLRDETDGEKYTAAYTFEHQGDSSAVTVYAALADKDFGADGAYAAPWYLKEAEKIKQEFVMADVKWFNDDYQMRLAPYFHRTQDTFWLNRDNPSFYRNDHTTYVMGNTLGFQSLENAFFAEIENRREYIRSTNLGERERFEHHLRIGLNEQPLGPLRYEVSMDGGYFDNFPAELSPRAAVFYDFADAWTVYTKAERKYRNPSFTELYYNSPSNIGNANLRLQQTDNYETGLLYKQKRWNAGGDVFFRDQKDTIDWVRNTGDTAFRAINAGAVDVKGFDLKGEWIVDWAALEKVTVSYTRLDITKAKDFDESKYVFDYLRDRVVFGLENSAARWDYGLRLAYEYHIDFKERWLLSSDATYHLNPDCDIFLMAENMLDQNYQEYRYIKGDPISVKSGVEIRF